MIVTLTLPWIFSESPELPLQPCCPSVSSAGVCHWSPTTAWAMAEKLLIEGTPSTCMKVTATWCVADPLKMVPLKRLTR